MWSTLMRTSLAFGGATSTSSIERGFPASQATAALHLMTYKMDKDKILFIFRKEENPVIPSKKGDQLCVKQSESLTNLFIVGDCVTAAVQSVKLFLLQTQSPFGLQPGGSFMFVGTSQ